mmetsp:Transcript_578/g.1870  ORF Transcript_578/g.1870 Transcript_578/m.1870 type:complete len:189 (+) Transcript_578:432-998(+)
MAEKRQLFGSPTDVSSVKLAPESVLVQMLPPKGATASRFSAATIVVPSAELVMVFQLFPRVDATGPNTGSCCAGVGGAAAGLAVGSRDDAGGGGDSQMEPSAAPSSLWTHAASFVPVESMLMLDQKVLFGADLSSTKRAPESEEYQMLPYQAAAATAVPSDDMVRASQSYVSPMDVSMTKLAPASVDI